MKQQFSIEGMSCNHCAARVEEAVSALDGVQKVKVNLKKQTVQSSLMKQKSNPKRSVKQSMDWDIKQR